MSKKESKDRKLARHSSFAAFYKFASAISLLTFFVVVVSGLMAEVSVVTITYRACVVIVLVAMIGRVLLSILATYEEMNSGQS